jgi:hypothetical protein
MSENVPAPSYIFIAPFDVIEVRDGNLREHMILSLMAGAGASRERAEAILDRTAARLFDGLSPEEAAARHPFPDE